MSSPTNTDVGSPDIGAPSNGMLAWLAAILLPLMALIIMFLVGIPKVYRWARPRSSVSSGGTSPTTVSSSDSQRRDLPHLDSFAPPRTSKDMRSNIMSHTHASWAEPASNMTCAICLGEVSDTDMLRQLDCQHIFHSDCIATWYLAEHDTCPQAHLYEGRIENV
ncbi:hypothetical protein FVER53590_25688 [Fusarium verticillioides]|nr:hypothetical protein FVER53590_25688 [Fusarium verticillioides]